MPGVPLFNSHGKGVNIFIQLFQQTDGLDDGFVLSVYIKWDLVAGESVAQTQPGMLQVYFLELVVLEESRKMLPDPSK